MEEKWYKIWIEGYSTTGEHSDAEYLGTWKGCTFQQSCVKMLNKSGWPLLYEAIQGLGECYYDPKDNSYWSRKFYDNEVDARKSFG